MARPLRVVARILLPAAAPAIALAGLTVFSLSLSELGVPMFLRVDTFPGAVFARLGGVDYAPGEAIAPALPLVPVVVGSWHSSGGSSARALSHPAASARLRHRVRLAPRPRLLPA